MYVPKRNVRGFTLIEILVVIGMLAILSTIVLVAVNPLRQFAQARNTERQNDVATILDAVSERIADNGGTFLNPSLNDGCSMDLPSGSTDVSKSTFDLRPCLVPTYLPEIPHDPSAGQNSCSDNTCSTGTYDLGYKISRDASNRVTVCAPGTAESALPGSTEFCLSR